LESEITFAGVQSLINRIDEIYFDVVIIDEAHLIGHEEHGSYRKILKALQEKNSNLFVVGLTATPWRLGHGLITEQPAIFDDLIEKTTILELIERGYLASLKSKLTKTQYDLKKIKKIAGDYSEKELQERLNTEELNLSVVNEIISFGVDRKSWLVFCAGVNHAKQICIELCQAGVNAECVTGETSKADREQILNDFKAGKIKALTNANVLTTGFDAPNIDLIAMLRPTMSPVLYVQMVGRGMRIKPQGGDCLVLDFAGNVRAHGPITQVVPPLKKGEKSSGEAPVKVCESCHEIVNINVKICPACKTPFPEPISKIVLKLDKEVDILGIDGIELEIKKWHWVVQESKSTGIEMLVCRYSGSINVIEYLTIKHSGPAGYKAMANLGLIAKDLGIKFDRDESIEYIC
jgi:DNA repair protein RadD